MIEGYEFAHFMARGMAMSGLDGGKFDRKEDLRLISVQKVAQRGKVLHRFKAQERGN